MALDTSLLTTGINTGLSGYSTSITQKAYGRQSAASAGSARLAAAEAPKQAAWEITRLRMNKRSILSSQRFAAGASGLVLTGTPVDIMQLTDQEMTLDELGIYREGQLQRAQYLEEAKAYDEAAAAARKAGKMGTIQSAIGIGTAVASFI